MNALWLGRIRQPVGSAADCQTPVRLKAVVQIQVNALIDLLRFKTPPKKGNRQIDAYAVKPKYLLPYNEFKEAESS
jgi:hypothetical protein